MRVAIDARKLAPIQSGIGVYTHTLVAGLLEADPGLEILLVRNGGRREADVAGPRVETVRVPFSADSPLTRLALGPLLRRRSFDLFHAPFDVSPRVAAPLVVTIHDLNWIVNPRYVSNNPVTRFFGGHYYRAALNASMTAARRIIAVSNATRNAIVEFAPWHEPKVRVVHDALDPDRVSAPATPPGRAPLPGIGGPANPFVLTVGQGLPYKNHASAVRGFLRAFGDRPEYRLLLVRRSAVADRELAALLRTPAARAQVVCLPHVAPEVLGALYAAARIVLHPSYYEGFGLPLLEAMAAGAPVVTSSVSSMPEVVGPAALLVSPGDADAIARALRALDADEALRARLIAEGRRRVKEFSRERFARETLDVYREAAGTRV